MKCKVLFLIPTLAGGGAERFFIHLLNNIDQTRFDPTLVVFRKEGPLFKDLKKEIPVIVLDTRLRNCLGKIARCIRITRPDVVLGTINFLNIMLGFARLLAFSNRTLFIARESGCPSQRSLYYKQLVNRDIFHIMSYRLFDRVVCQSDDMLEDVHRTYKIPRHKLVKIHNPVDCELIWRRAAKSPSLFNAGCVNLVTAGRLDAQKGFDMLLHAMALTANPRLHLHILGEGEEETSLKRLAQELQVTRHVTFHGFKSNPYPYMAQADAYVLSSRWEGLPNAMMEAMALGCPAIAYTCPGGITEIIVEGRNGFMVSPGDIRKLAESMNAEAYRLLDRRIVAASIKDRFGLRPIVQQYERLLLGNI